MGWQDRDYYRDDGSGGGGGGSGFFQGLARLLNASFPIGIYLGIRVRVHVLFVAMVIYYLIKQGYPAWTLRWISLLFASVLLHEFGHALACRKVGGTASDILMWPLGGLAYCAPPPTPWANFVTVIWGPLVNVIIAAGCYASLMAMGIHDAVSLHPFHVWGTFRYWGAAGLLQDMFVVNYSLTLFNMMLMFYPFDGGRIVQIALWKMLGYQKSMGWALTIGTIGAVGVILLGLANGNTLLACIGAFGLITCLQQRAFLRQEGPAYPISQAREARPGLVSRWRSGRIRQRRDRELARQNKLDSEVDRILSKVKERGLQSLTEGEKRTLQRATDRQRRAG